MDVVAALETALARRDAKLAEQTNATLAPPRSRLRP
jgi:hypothetical protein